MYIELVRKFDFPPAYGYKKSSSRTRLSDETNESIFFHSL